MSIRVDLQSAALPKRLSPLEIYRPRHQTYSNGNSRSQYAEHLDVVETWKGLRYAQAVELAFWTDATRAALAKVLEDQLLNDFILDEANLDTMPVNIILSRMAAYVNRHRQQTFKWRLSSLLDIVNQYHTEHGAHFDWLRGGVENLDERITNFLRTLDIFRQEDLGLCILDFDLHATVGEETFNTDTGPEVIPLLKVRGTILSSPHRLDFIEHPNNVLKPLFKEPILCFDFLQSLVQVELEEVLYQAASIVVTKQFPGNVRLERAIRIAFPRSRTKMTLDPHSCPSWEDLSSIPTTVPRVKLVTPSKTLPRTKKAASALVSLPIRAISSGSARVQGTGLSDFERSAKRHHPHVALAYDKYLPLPKKGENAIRVNMQTSSHSPMIPSTGLPHTTHPSVQRCPLNAQARNYLESYAEWAEQSSSPTIKQTSNPPTSFSESQPVLPLHRKSYDDTSESSRKTKDQEQNIRGDPFPTCSKDSELDNALVHFNGPESRQMISELPRRSPRIKKKPWRDYEAEALTHPRPQSIHANAAFVTHSPVSRSKDEKNQYKSLSPVSRVKPQNEDSYKDRSPLAQRMDNRENWYQGSSSVAHRLQNKEYWYPASPSGFRPPCQVKRNIEHSPEENTKSLNPVPHGLPNGHDRTHRRHSVSPARQASPASPSNTVSTISTRLQNTHLSQDLEQERIIRNYEEFLGSRNRVLSQTEKEDQAAMEQAFASHGSSETAIGSDSPSELSIISISRSTSLKSSTFQATSMASEDIEMASEDIENPSNGANNRNVTEISVEERADTRSMLRSLKRARKISPRFSPVSAFPSPPHSIILSQPRDKGKAPARSSPCLHRRYNAVESSYRNEQSSRFSRASSSSIDAPAQRCVNAKRYCDRDVKDTSLARHYEALMCSDATNIASCQHVNDVGRSTLGRDRASERDAEIDQEHTDWPDSQDDDPTYIDDNPEKWDVEDFLAEEEDNRRGNHIFGY